MEGKDNRRWWKFFFLSFRKYLLNRESDEKIVFSVFFANISKTVKMAIDKKLPTSFVEEREDEKRRNQPEMLIVLCSKFFATISKTFKVSIDNNILTFFVMERVKGEGNAIPW